MVSAVRVLTFSFVASTSRCPGPGRHPPPAPRGLVPAPAPPPEGPVFLSRAHGVGDGAPGAGRRVVRGVSEGLLFVTSPSIRPRLTVLFSVFVFIPIQGPRTDTVLWWPCRPLSTCRPDAHREVVRTSPAWAAAGQDPNADAQAPGQPWPAANCRLRTSMPPQLHCGGAGRVATHQD